MLGFLDAVMQTDVASASTLYRVEVTDTAHTTPQEEQQRGVRVLERQGMLDKNADNRDLRRPAMWSRDLDGWMVYILWHG